MRIAITAQFRALKRSLIKITARSAQIQLYELPLALVECLAAPETQQREQLFRVPIPAVPTLKVGILTNS